MGTGYAKFLTMAGGDTVVNKPDIICAVLKSDSEFHKVCPMNHFVEFRSYTLKPGSRQEFQRLFLEEAFPMLKRWNVDVVAYGPSLHDENSYYLIRRFDSLAHREQSEESFYGSAEWRRGPREAILALIENYTEFVLELDEATVQGLRK